METEELSPRKKQIIKCLKAGCIADEEIAERLKISVNTVESHIQQLYSLLCIEGKAKRAKLVWEVMR
jgi:DNA-binding NarL/FixJ family response regulator